jgi:hypothetical protein
LRKLFDYNLKSIADAFCSPLPGEGIARWAGHYAVHLDPMVDFWLINLDAEIETKKPWWS